MWPPEPPPECTSSSAPTPAPLQAQQRDLTVRRVKDTEKELGRQLRQQREHYEATIQRHLSFIDQVTLPGGRAAGQACQDPGGQGE